MIRTRRLQVLAGMLLAVLAVFFTWALAELPTPEAPLLPIEYRLDQPHTAYPVTTVALSFRGYNTFLELGVLLLTALGAWSLGRGFATPPRSLSDPAASTIGRLLAPGLAVIGVYLVWTRASEPGGAFLSGAVLAAAGILVVLTFPGIPLGDPGSLLRLGLLTGAIAFLSLGLIEHLHGLAPECLPTSRIEAIAAAIEAVASLAIAVSLVALYLGGGAAETQEGRRNDQP